MANITNTPNPNLIPLIIDKNHLVKTGFMEHFNVLLEETVHYVYLNITTNELVFQRDAGDITVNFSLSGLPDVNATNSTSGDVLVYSGSNWINKTVDDALNYINSNPSTRFTDILGVTSAKNALDQILYPYIQPSFSSLSIENLSYNLELGEYINGSNGGNSTFLFNTNSLTNVSITDLKILDITNSYTISTTIPYNSTSALLNIPYGITKTNDGDTNVFRIIGKDTHDNFFEQNVIYTWRPRIYWGTSPLTSINSTQILNLSSSKLSTNMENSFVVNGNGEYIYIVLPTTYGKMISYNGEYSHFRVGNMTNSFWEVYEISHTNIFGYTTTYNVYRSNNISFGNGMKIDIVDDGIPYGI